jgi:hypothetical protein
MYIRATNREARISHKVRLTFLFGTSTLRIWHDIGYHESSKALLSGTPSGHATQAVLRESGLRRSANDCTTQELNPIHLLNEFEEVLVLQNDRPRRSLAPSPEMAPRRA